MTEDADIDELPEPGRWTVPGEADAETVTTTAADVESAGRSCMAIVVLLGLIVFLLIAWLALRSFGVGP